MKKHGEFTFKIVNKYIDFTGRATIKTITDIVLHSASENAAENGFGIDNLIKNGVTWVLARLSIDMEYLPKLNETVIVRTWISNIAGFHTERKFIIYCGEQKIGTASSMWAILDLSTRKPIDLSTVDVLNTAQIDIKTDIPDSIKVRCIDSVEIERRDVRYSDLDMNNHVNSLKYIEWIYDTMPLEWHSESPFYSMLINYQSEVVYGNSVSIRKSPKKPFHYDIYNPEGVNTTKIAFKHR